MGEVDDDIDEGGLGDLDFFGNGNGGGNGGIWSEDKEKKLIQTKKKTKLPDNINLQPLNIGGKLKTGEIEKTKMKKNMFKQKEKGTIKINP